MTHLNRILIRLLEQPRHTALHDPRASPIIILQYVSGVRLVTDAKPNGASYRTRRSVPTEKLVGSLRGSNFGLRI